jgi:hypothetical protein
MPFFIRNRSGRTWKSQSAMGIGIQEAPLLLLSSLHSP